MAVAIVLAAGSGSRMQSDVAKQYMMLDGREVLYYSLRTLCLHEQISEIVLVTREQDISYCKNEIVDRYHFDKVTKIIPGGKERYDSVYEGLLALEDSKDRAIVMVHDGARPFISEEMIDNSIAAANEFGGCTVAVPAKDTIRLIDEDGFAAQTLDRNFVYQIQTPQTFKYEILRAAHEKMREENKEGNHKITDDTMMVERYGGVQTKIVPGAYENLKITTPEDIEIAKIFCKKK